MIELSFFNWVGKVFNEKVSYFTWFLRGLLFGTIAIILIGLIMFLISKSKKLVNNLTKYKALPIKEEYKDIIKKNKEEYLENYKGIDVKNKINGISKIMANMLNDISKLYYPESSDPIFEVNIDQLVDLTGYIIHRINYTLDRMLEGRLKVVNSFAKNDIKNKRFSSFIKQKEEKPTEEIQPKKESKLSRFFKNKVKNIGMKIGMNIADKELALLIEDIGEDINKLYSKQSLIFSDMTKKQMKLNKKLSSTLVEEESEEE